MFEFASPMNIEMYLQTYIKPVAGFGVINYAIDDNIVLDSYFNIDAVAHVHIFLR